MLHIIRKNILFPHIYFIVFSNTFRPRLDKQLILMHIALELITLELTS